MGVDLSKQYVYFEECDFDEKYCYMKVPVTDTKIDYYLIKKNYGDIKFKFYMKIPKSHNWKYLIPTRFGSVGVLEKDDNCDMFLLKSDKARDKQSEKLLKRVKSFQRNKNKEKNAELCEYSKTIKVDDIEVTTPRSLKSPKSLKFPISPRFPR